MKEKINQVTTESPVEVDGSNVQETIEKVQTVEKTKKTPKDVELKQTLKNLMANKGIKERLENIVVLTFKRYANLRAKKEIYPLTANEIEEINVNNVMAYKPKDIVKVQFHGSNKKYSTEKIYDAVVVGLFKYSMNVEYMVDVLIDGGKHRTKKRQSTILDLNPVELNKSKQINFDLHDAKFEDFFKDAYTELVEKMKV